MGDTTTLTLDQLIETIRTFPKGECAIAIVIKKPYQDVRVIQWRVDTEEDLHKLLEDVRALYPEHSNSELMVARNVVSVVSNGRPMPVTGHIQVTLS